jgi:hypothetical protein
MSDHRGDNFSHDRWAGQHGRQGSKPKKENAKGSKGGAIENRESNDCSIE